MLSKFEKIVVDSLSYLIWKKKTKSERDSEIKDKLLVDIHLFKNPPSLKESKALSNERDDLMGNDAPTEESA